MCVLYQMAFEGMAPFNGAVYTWLLSDGRAGCEVGFLIDRLTAMMMAVVTFVSLMVHIYTIGYMHEDDGYQRFFSYISLFTFSMLMLVMANNFMQLFFGWEGVGVVSYLLIGFWYQRPDGDLRQPQGISGQSRRRFRFRSGDRGRACATRDRWITPRCSRTPVRSQPRKFTSPAR